MISILLLQYCVHLHCRIHLHLYERSATSVVALVVAHTGLSHVISSMSEEILIHTLHRAGTLLQYSRLHIRYSRSYNKSSH